MNKKVLITVNDDCPLVPGLHKKLRDAGIPTKQADITALDEEGLIRQASDCTSSISAAECWTERVFDALPEFECIIKSGVGLDAIDLDSATRHGVLVANTPGQNATGVAEMAATQILSLVRNTAMYDRRVRNDQWMAQIIYGHELSALTVGLIGFGYIAQNLARMLSGFGCRIIACDVRWNEAAAEKLHVERASFEEVLQTADVISLHVPLTEETRECINRKTLAMMKPETVLVNTARGGLICENDLYEALRDRVIAGAALDVTTIEPLPMDSPLLKLDNIQFTPHTATCTQESIGKLYDACFRQTMQYYNGERVDNIVNPRYTEYQKK